MEIAQYSMTGFGKASAIYQGKKLTVEIKCLNSKQLDLFVKIPHAFRDLEGEVRTVLKNRIVRGKVDFCISMERVGDVAADQHINQGVVLGYYNQLKEIAQVLGYAELPKTDLLRMAISMPDILNASEDEENNDEITLLRELVESCINECVAFREQEGKALIADMLKRVAMIRAMADEVSPFEKERIVTIREKLEERFRELELTQNIDKNRFEQELIYYLEKLDITEEQVRLRNHCRYFEETVAREAEAGRKLGFIAQEMGREINTLGSKSNDHEMQKIVIRMKDELEKIKEQVLNIL